MSIPPLRGQPPTQLGTSLGRDVGRDVGRNSVPTTNVALLPGTVADVGSMPSREATESQPRDRLQRCVPHDLAYDPEVADGCVLCRSHEPNSEDGAQFRARLWRRGVALATILGLCGAVYVRRLSRADKVRVREVSLQEVTAGLSQGGAQVTIIHLWGTWCASCREELPVFDQLRRAFTDRELELRMVAIHEASTDSLREFMLDNHLAFAAMRLVPNTNVALRAALEETGMRYRLAVPYTAVFDASGMLVDQWTGVRARPAYRDLVRRLAGG